MEKSSTSVPERGKQPLSHRAPYATSKMGIIGFTRTLAADVGRYNITVNAICPGQHEERSLELTRDRAAYNNEAFDEGQFRESFNRYQSDDRPVLAGTWCADEGFQEASSGPEEAAAFSGLSGLRCGRHTHGSGHQLRWPGDVGTACSCRGFVRTSRGGVHSSYVILVKPTGRTSFFLEFRGTQTWQLR